MTPGRRTRRARLAGVAILAAAVAGPAMAGGDPAQGEALFRTCAACHMIGDGAAHGVGPHLNGIVGRPIGAVAGYGFSEGLTAAGAQGRVWDEAALDRFLAAPRDEFPGTRMAFRGVRSEADRAHLIAYLRAAGGPPDTAAGVPPDSETVDPAIAAILAIPGDVAYGEFLANECTACHVATGGAGIPTIRGLAPSVFVAGLAAYRDGTRTHQVMNTVARRLGDAEIAALAAYFAGLE